jgi:hypothetical protein
MLIKFEPGGAGLPRVHHRARTFPFAPGGPAKADRAAFLRTTTPGIPVNLEF